MRQCRISRQTHPNTPNINGLLSTIDKEHIIMTAPFSDPHFAISLYCSDFRNPAAQVEVLNNYADSYHVDIMDGHFSPAWACAPPGSSR